MAENGGFIFISACFNTCFMLTGYQLIFISTDGAAWRFSENSSLSLRNIWCELTYTMYYLSNTVETISFETHGSMKIIRYFGISL